MASAQGTGPGGVDTNLQLWMRADAGVTETGGNTITSWQDQTGAHTPATITSDPDLLDAGADLLNFNPVVEFDSTDNIQWTGDDFTTAFTEGEVFVIGKEGEPATAARNALFDFGGSGNQHYTYNNLYIYDDFGANGRKNWIPSNTSTAAGEGAAGATVSGPNRDTTDYHIINFASATNDWHAAFDGVPMVHDTTNVVNFSGVPALGQSADARIAEVVLYDRKLNAAERLQVNSSLAIKYGLTLGTDSIPVQLHKFERYSYLERYSQQ